MPGSSPPSEELVPPDEDSSPKKSLPTQIPVRHRDITVAEPCRDLFGDGDRAVLTARATNRQRHIPLTLAFKPLADRLAGKVAVRPALCVPGGSGTSPTARWSASVS